MKRLLLFLILLVFGFRNPENKNAVDDTGSYLIVLGTAQDAGYPQVGCNKECCKYFYSGKVKKQNATCLAMVDNSNHKLWMFEATPDFKDQWRELQVQSQMSKMYPDGIFITHAHIGHYTGLIQLGREVMGAKNVPVYTMPRLDSFLVNNGPWSQLVKLNNISLNKLREDSTVVISDSVKVTPFRVPHRDEYSETVGFKIESLSKKVLFIPDIDKWEKWNRNIADEIKKVDVAFIDATFFKEGELPGKSMKDIPHPFVQETMNLLASLPPSEKRKIYFIHFNHTNPLIWDKATQEQVISSGFNFATEGLKIAL